MSVCFSTDGVAQEAEAKQCVRMRTTTATNLKSLTREKDSKSPSSKLTGKKSSQGPAKKKDR